MRIFSGFFLVAIAVSAFGEAMGISGIPFYLGSLVFYVGLALIADGAGAKEARKALRKHNRDKHDDGGK